MIVAVIQGFVVGGGLIIAIGPQNAFVLNQGLKQQHVFLTALVCSLIDIVLISTGVFGLGELFQLHAVLVEMARWFGAIFLTFYGVSSFKSALHPKTLRNENLKSATTSTKKIIFILLSLGFLNPHAYLDTVVLIGSIAAQHPGNARFFFGLGAALASIVWFFGIAYGARILTPFFKKESSWRILDIIIGGVMLVIAVRLILPIFS